MPESAIAMPLGDAADHCAKEFNANITTRQNDNQYCVQRVDSVQKRFALFLADSTQLSHHRADRPIAA
jgi:hypothetical protein